MLEQRIDENGIITFGFNDIMTRLTKTGEYPDGFPGNVAYAVAWAQTVGGWMTDQELLWLAQQASQLAPGSIWVEIGTHCGRSYSAVSLALPDACTAIAIDLWEITFIDVSQGRDKSSAHLDFLETFDALARLRPKVVLDSFQTHSVDASREFPDGSVDVVFIDGAHDYASVMADITAWLPKVKKGGLICGHDANETGVASAVRDVLGTLEIAVDSIWSYSVK